MSDTFELNTTGLDELRSAFSHDEHFQSIAWPRIRLINAIKDELEGAGELVWRVKYSPVNRAGNGIVISLPDERRKFHFYYTIPLSLRLTCHLYLGDNTFNFFEAHPLLIEQGIISAEEFRVEATSNTLPHLVLSQSSDRYEQHLLAQAIYDSQELRQSGLFQLLERSFKKFNQPLLSIINGTYQL